MEKIEARVIMEMMGRPAEHLSETLNTFVVKMGSEEGIKITNKKYHPPKEVEAGKDLYTAFAEVELEFDSIEKILLVIYLYSPSNIEVISPENLKISNDNLNSFFNSLLERIHNQGGLLKRAVTERDILIKQIEYLREKMGPELEKHMKINLLNKNPPVEEKKDKPLKKKSTKKKSKKSK
ncbi:hypothetical protein AUJ84_00120 [Candidatus Pacearchaeota archaeon CG1_02_32_132]|nr:MAG: hypothetical protein AUJ84_00120 [Candidatus Pacearchaeota archaeon CG1_02_32_132]